MLTCTNSDKEAARSAEILESEKPNIEPMAGVINRIHFFCSGSKYGFLR